MASKIWKGIISIIGAFFLMLLACAGFYGWGLINYAYKEGREHGDSERDIRNDIDDACAEGWKYALGIDED